MDKKQLIIFLTIVVLICSGCYSMCVRKLDRSIENSRVFDSTYDIVWDSIIKSMTNGERITLVQKENGLVSFRRLIPVDKVMKYTLLKFRCLNQIADVTITINREGDSKTRVNVIPQFIRIDIGEVDGSSGELEREYLDQIAYYLSRGNEKN